MRCGLYICATKNVFICGNNKGNGKNFIRMVWWNYKWFDVLWVIKVWQYNLFIRVKKVNFLLMYNNEQQISMERITKRERERERESDKVFV